MPLAEGPPAVQLRGSRQQAAGRWLPPRHFGLGARARAVGLALLALGALLALSDPAGAAGVATLQAQARALAAKVDALNTRLSILSEEYDQASAHAATLHTEVRRDTVALGAARAQVGRDAAILRRQAVSAYVTAGSSSSMSAALSGSPDALPTQQAYLRAASGDLTTAISSLQLSEHQLSVRQQSLAAVTAAADQNAATLLGARQSATGLEAQLNSSLSGVQGQLAAAVAQQEAAQRAAVAARQVVAAAAAAAANPAPSATLTDAPTGGGNGSAAVQAALSVLGSPYVWAGASPAGFDCSGLAMWAWAHAGVDLPHSAQAQYDSIEHVALSDLEPGDLVFYASGGYIYHVIMYIGGGRAVQAINEGTVVQITPVWSGAYGAGRP